MTSPSQKIKAKWSKLSDTQKTWTIFLIIVVCLSLASQGNQTASSPPKSKSTSRPISKLDSKISPAEFIPACIAAHEAIKSKLLSPATADFPNCVYAAEDHDIKNWGLNKFMMYGYVDSQNMYGAQIRQKWWATLMQKDDFTFEPLDFGIY